MKKKFKRLIGYSLTMGGTGLIAGALPTTAKAPVQTIATTGSMFVVPMASVTGASIVIKHLDRLKLKKLKRRYK